MASVEQINIKNFKSHSSFHSNIEGSQVAVFGNNGIGKTNLLESLSFFSNSKGMRGNKLENFFQNKNEVKSKFLKVDCVLKQENYSTNISYQLVNESDQINKDFFIDNKKSSQQQINGLVNFIWLSPHMDKIMYEGLSTRKTFIDKLISNLDQNFKKNLSDFKKLSDERILLLINNGDKKWISIVEEKMSKIFYKILLERRQKILSLNSLSKNYLTTFKKFQINIENNLEEIISQEDKCVEEIIKMLFINRSLDESVKRNTFSPSIDQINFFDCNKNLNAELCSTGEQKSILLSIILAFAWTFKQKHIPFIMLFDEISSHIDEKNMVNFFNEVAKLDTQAWYTGTDKKIFQVIENKAFFIDLA